MPHEVRVLSWVQLLLCIRLRAGERGFICTDRNVAPSRNSKESTHRNVRASIKFTGELFKFSGYRDTDFERESSGFYDRLPLRSMRHDQSLVYHRRIEHLRGGIWQLRFHWEPFNPVCFVPLFRYSFQRR